MRAILDVDTGVGYLIERLSAEPGELTLVCTAPPPSLPTRVCTQVEAARFKALFFQALGLPLQTQPSTRLT